MIAAYTRLLMLLPGLVVITLASLLIMQPDPQRDASRTVEQLWQERRITEVRERLMLDEQMPAVRALSEVRLALIELRRGDCAAAQHRAANALRLPARRDEAALAHLIVGICAAQSDQMASAEAHWGAVDPRSPYAALPLILRAEHAVTIGAFPVAQAHYQQALKNDPPDPWRSLARLRLALIVAGSDSEEAARLVAAIPATLPATSPELQAFLPLAPHAISSQARQLHAILDSNAPQQAQLLGQQLIDLRLYRLAIARLESAATGPRGSAYAAYARAQLGQTSAALAQLEELVAATPDDPAIGTMYATAALQANQTEAADQALRNVEAVAPLDPAIALVRSDVLAQQRQYPQAVAELRRARDIAQPDVRARFALALVRQQLSLTYDLCGSGVAAARESTTIAPTDPAAWHALAEVHYHCRAYAAAAEAARTGLQHDAYDPALRFFLGAALWEQGQREAARPQLIAAADLAPASEWRVRAEELLNS